MRIHPRTGCGHGQAADPRGLVAGSPTVAAHGGFRGNHFGQRFDCSLCLGLLNETDDSIEDYDAGDDRRIHPFAENCRDAGRHKQDVNQWLVKLLKKLEPGWRATACSNSIWAKLRPTSADFIRRQPGRKIYPEELNNFFGCQIVLGLIL